MKIVNHRATAQFQIAQSGELLRAFARLIFCSPCRILRARALRCAAANTNQERDAQYRFHILPFLRNVFLAWPFPKTLSPLSLARPLSLCEYTRAFPVFHTEYLKIRPQSEMLLFLLLLEVFDDDSFGPHGSGFLVSLRRVRACASRDCSRASGKYSSLGL